MAQALKDSFLDLERHRDLLQKNIESLQKTMRHWQLWEAEYEGLKEDILDARSAPLSREDLLSICGRYEGELVTRKEINDILGLSTPRTPAQVVNVLDRRIDYVEQNVRSLQKQIETAENKLAAISIISTPEVRNEEGLPLTEIMEELDPEGNIVSSHLSTPGSSKLQLMEVLQKAGVADLPDSSKSSSAVPFHNDKQQNSAIEPEAQNTRHGVSKPQQTGTPAKVAKGVDEPERLQVGKRVEEFMSVARQQEIRTSEPPIIPSNESSEDATLRREMLRYGMSEIGAVVAELDVEEDGSWSGEDVEEDGPSTSDDEDSFGRSTGRTVDDELRQQMIELEKRLGVQAMQNIGKRAGDYDIVEEGIGRVTINQVPDMIGDKISKEAPKITPMDQLSTKKTVRFAEELDISPAPKPSTKESTVKLAPVSDIVERKVPESVLPVTQKKPSRFKTAPGNPGVVNGPLAVSPQTSLPLYRARPLSPKPFSQPIQFNPVEDTRVVPTGPEGRTLANIVVERDTQVDASTAEPDEIDPHLLHQEVASEYYKIRNRMIHRQGGFLKEEDNEIVPFTEEEGGPKRVSRFKAARLAKS